MSDHRLNPNTNTELTYNPAIPLLGTYPEEVKTGVSIAIYNPTSIAALFTIAQRWEQPSVHGWMNR